MKTTIHLGLALGASSLLGVSAPAQTITPLLVEGDVLPHGSVTAIYDVDVNDRGDWLLEVDTNGGPLADNAIVFNGALIHQEGSSLGLPASHSGTWIYDEWVDSMEINDNRDRLVIMNVADVSSILPDRKLLLWTNGATGVTYVLMEENVTLNTVAGEPVGATWRYIEEAWQNNSNEIMIAGRSDSDSDDMLATIIHDGAGSITGQTLFAIDGVNHAAAFPPSNGVHLTPVQGFSIGAHSMALNDAGQKLFYVDDDHTVSGGSTAVDSHYYVDTLEVAFEGDVAPTSLPFNHLDNAEVDLNDGGDWVAAFYDDQFSGFILVNGAAFAVEGDPAPGVSGGFTLQGISYTNGHVQISDLGDVTWTAQWNDPDATRDKGLYRNYELLVQEGVTTIGAATVTDIRSTQSGEEMAVSDNGVYILKELEVTGDLEGAYMVELALAEYFCFGDGSDVGCPCGNIGASGEGCANSSGSGSVIEITGSPSVSAGNMVLVSTGSPAGKPGVFFQGDALENAGAGVVFGDGVRCVGGTLQRFGVEVTDASGNASTAYDTIPAKAATAGDTRHYQWWHRDPQASPCAGEFNVSNAATVTWVL